MPAYAYPDQNPSYHLGEDRDEILVANGFDIVVYASTPTRVPDEVRQQYKKIKKETSHDGHIVTYRYSLMAEKKSTIQRALRYTVQCIKLFNRAVFCKDARSCDVMWMSSTPPLKCMFLGFAKTFTHIPLIMNVQDIFPDSLVGTGMSNKNSLVWKLGNVISNYAYKKADRIVVISKGFKDNLIAKGVPEEKIDIIYNWIDEDQVYSIPRDNNPLFDQYKLDKSLFYLSYCGNIGLTQNMDMLLKVMAELKTEYPNIHLILVGDGAYKQTVESIVESQSLNNVHMIPFQPYENIAQVFSMGDVGLVISKQGVSECSVPSKTWSILSASRPVLASFDENELKDIINEYQCGLFTLANDKKAFKDSIIRLFNDRKLTIQMGTNGRTFIEKNLSKKAGVEQFIKVIYSVL
jgi:glycosyltransferase involved in cell wall biosynthesis